MYSMNELIAIRRNRATFIGEPAREEGSPMAKYTYYIDFIRKLFGLDITDIIRKNLNDYRVYQKLGLRFVCLNTVAEVSTLRNNKMQLDERFAEELPEIEAKDDFTNIYLMHHTPYCKSDYNSDKYWVKDMDLNAYETFKDMIKKMQEGGEEKRKYFEGKKLKGQVESDNIIKDRNNILLYNDMIYLFEHWKETTNERCKQIVDEYKRNEEMAEIDYQEFLERWKKCRAKVSCDIILGGHVHEKRSTVKAEPACYVGKRFYENRSVLNYGVLEIRGDKTFEYVFYPHNKKQTEQDAPKCLDENRFI